MEIVNIEKQTYEMMLHRLRDLTFRVAKICKTHSDPHLQEWLDNQELCFALNVSKRTLQTLRDNGSLPYTMVNHKVYYRTTDVEKFLNTHKSR